MSYDSNIEEAQDLATKALTFLGAQNLPPVPNNYALAYSYFSGNRPGLNNQIEKQIAVGGIDQSDMVAL